MKPVQTCQLYPVKLPLLLRPPRALLVLGLGFASLLFATEPWNAPESAAQTKNPVASSSDIIAMGRKLYLDRCADCHGKKARGDGGGGADLERKPTDLTATPVQTQSDGTLFWKISEGRRPMPAYGRKLSEEQRWQVIHFLRSLHPRNKPQPENRKSPAQPQDQP